MKNSEILHIIRNPNGHTDDKVREARNAAANRIEALEKSLKKCNGWTARAISLEVSSTMQGKAEQDYDEAKALLDA